MFLLMEAQVNHANLSQVEIVEMIFTKLSLVYGRDFLSRWEGLDLDAVKSDWLHELSGYSVDAIRHALRNLPPSRPPTVLEFRNIANGVPAQVYQRIDAPQANPALVREHLAKARAALRIVG